MDNYLSYLHMQLCRTEEEAQRHIFDIPLYFVPVGFGPAPVCCYLGARTSSSMVVRHPPVA